MQVLYGLHLHTVRHDIQKKQSAARFDKGKGYIQTIQKRNPGLGLNRKGEKMQDFKTYDYQISLKDLEDTAREVIKHGYNVTIIINGECDRPGVDD